MNRKLVRIAPWQAAKVCAVIYFMLGLVVGIFFALGASFTTSAQGEPSFGRSIAVAIAMPFIYAIAALIFVPVGCWVYNFAARLVGGFEVEVESSA